MTKQSGEGGQNDLLEDKQFQEPEMMWAWSQQSGTD
jgi:hypothetical protein